LAVELAGAATLIRSIAYDRWITVLASVLLLVGATATRRGRAWGVGLTFAAASAFPVAWAIGIAPAWFGLIGLLGALPFALMTRAFVRFDARATALLAAIAAALGASGAIAWKQYHLVAFQAFPSLLPSLHFNHGLAISALISATLVAKMRFRAESTASVVGLPRARARIAPTAVEAPAAAFEEEDLLDSEEDTAIERRARAR
jgi:hypothetical protein